MIFVDTSTWFAAVVPTSSDHPHAARWLAANSERLLTTDYVVDETLTLLRARGERQRASLMGERFFESTMTEVYFLTEDDIRKAWSGKARNSLRRTDVGQPSQTVLSHQCCRSITRRQTIAYFDLKSLVCLSQFQILENDGSAHTNRSNHDAPTDQYYRFTGVQGCDVGWNVKINKVESKGDENRNGKDEDPDREKQTALSQSDILSAAPKEDDLSLKLEAPRISAVVAAFLSQLTKAVCHAVRFAVGYVNQSGTGGDDRNKGQGDGDTMLGV